ncbi:MAG: MFS transporter [Litorilinea sp.]
MLKSKAYREAQRESEVVFSRMIQRVPFFYGWVILAASTLGMIMTSPGQTFAISIFLEYFIADLDVSRGLVSTFYTVGTLTASFALPFVGRQIDQRPVRVMVAVIAVVFGIACIYMGMVQNAIMLLFGFMGVRMMGQGSLGMVSTYIINQWWVRRRGMMMGLSGVVMSLLGMGTFPSLLNWMIPQFGWRGTYIILGIVLICVMAPIGYLLYRDRPERYGLRPDSAAKPVPSVDNLPVAEENWTLQEARSTSAFWIVTGGLSAMSMLGTGLMFHMVSIFADNELSAAVYVPVAMTTAVVNLGSGILVDRLSVRYLLSGALLLQAAALWLALTLNGVGMAIFYGIVLGSMSGLQRTISSVAWAKYFGRRHLGSITGLAATISVAASALGPMPMGVARDMFGSYHQALMLLSVLPLCLSVWVLFMKPPQKATPSE